MRYLLFLLVLPTLHGQVTAKVDAHAEHFGQLSRQIWELAELGYKEHKSSQLLQDELRKSGFHVESNIAGIPTAFVATYGAGGPVIGLMAEYDALPGLSQNDVPRREPRVDKAPGHGCGHNLLGAGSVLAAIALKEQGFKGTLKVFGTPAEEGGSGKVFMIRAGVFNGVDAVLSWHPGDSNRLFLSTTLANISARVRFRGQAAHAASAPDQGRSALDAVMLFTHAVELLREHIPQETRVHYTISNGGAAPNIVPDFAEVYIYARHPSMKALDNVWSRLEKAAAGAALGTETTHEVAVQSAVYNMLPNEVLSTIADRHLRALGGFEYSNAELAFAASLRKTLIPGAAELPIGSQATVLPIERDGVISASTDAADVSWVVPTVNLGTASLVPGVPVHSWQATACAGMSIGRKGMVLAAKTLALTAVDLYENPSQLAAIRASFDKSRAGFSYRSRIPADAPPPLNYRDTR